MSMNKVLIDFLRLFVYVALIYQHKLRHESLGLGEVCKHVKNVTITAFFLKNETCQVRWVHPKCTGHVAA